MPSKRFLPVHLSALASAAVLMGMAVLPGTLPAQTADAARVAARITAPIDDKSTVSLKGTVHHLATAAHDRGPVDDSAPVERIQLLLKRSDAQESALKQRIADMQTPGSVSYHKWLTPQQFGKQFGPADADVAKLTTWLGAHGFSNVKLSPGGQTLEFSGTAGQFKQTFQAELHKYRVNGRTHTANASDPKLPAAITPVVRGFASLNNFPLRSYAKVMGKAAYTPATHRSRPSWTVGDSTNGYSFLLAPGDFAVQYDLNSLYTAGTTGKGQTIGIINESNVSPAIVAQYRSLFGLSANPLNVIIDGNDPGIDGNNNPDGPNGASGEAYLDVELSGSVAPDATVDLIIAGDTALANGLGIAAEHAVYGNTAPILSLSFGQCELFDGPDGNAFWNSLWEQAAAQGQTIMVSTGDSGSAGCDDDNTQQYAVFGQQVNGIASTPWNVAVGGTDFYYSSYNGTSSEQLSQLEQYWGNFASTASNSTPTTTLLSRVPEQPWNDSQYGDNLFNLYQNGDGTTIAGGSGGASNCATANVDANGNVTSCIAGYPKPTWQVGNGVPADGVRDLPDVSLFAANGQNYTYYPICAGDGDCQPVDSGGTVQITGIGGTSASTPAFAGVMALVNQKYGAQGQADFILYPLFSQHPNAFNDVTNGSNAVPCNLDTVSADGQTFPPTDCIAAAGTAITGDDPTFGSSTEGELGNTAANTPDYNATTGYDLASGLGTIDAANLVNSWGDVTFANSGVTLVPSSTTFVHGTSIDINGNVTPSTGGGAVALETTSTEPLQTGQTTFAVSGGTYSGSVNFLPGGTYQIFGKYSGDGTVASSSSTPVTITVTPEASVTSLNIYNVLSNSALTSGATLPYGTQTLLDASPTPVTVASSGVYGTPTGTVTFTDGSATLTSATINAIGEAEFNQAFAIGTHSVIAAYSGDNSYLSSTSASTTFTITQDTPILTLSGGASPAVSGSTTLTVQVENFANGSASTAAYLPAAAPTGVVTVTGLPSGTLTFPALTATRDPFNQAAEGVAVLPLGTQKAGTYNVTISYPGDTNYAATTSTASIVVTAPVGIPTSTTVSASQNATSTSYALQVTATVSGTTAGGPPTGTLTFSSSGVDLGYLTIPTGGTGDIYTTTVSLDSEALIIGSNVITVQYSGDTNYAPSAGTVTLDNQPGTVPTPGGPALVLNAAPITISSPGGSGTSTVVIAPSNGFTGQVSLTCTVSGGSTTDAPTCAVTTPGAITGTTPATATLTVTTTAATTAALTKPRFSFAPFGGVAVAGLLFFLAPIRRRKIASLFVVLLTLAGAGLVVGCGGGSSSSSGTGGTSNPGTTAGTYTVTVTATATGVSTATTAVSVVVQ